MNSHNARSFGNPRPPKSERNPPALPKETVFVRYTPETLIDSPNTFIEKAYIQTTTGRYYILEKKDFDLMLINEHGHFFASGREKGVFQYNPEQQCYTHFFEKKTESFTPIRLYLLHKALPSPDFKKIEPGDMVKSRLLGNTFRHQINMNELLYEVESSPKQKMPPSILENYHWYLSRSGLRPENFVCYIDFMYVATPTIATLKDVQRMHLEYLGYFSWTDFYNHQEAKKYFKLNELPLLENLLP